METSFEFTVIGRVHSPFREKFGAPRQAGLATAALGEIELAEEFSAPETFAALDGFSHLWLVFVFHQVAEGEWHPTVRPPRLGGNRRVGVWASRSPFRPNRIGLSAVKIESVRAGDGVIGVSGLDLVDGTPILDIKPYVPYCDALQNADAGYASPPRSPVADSTLVVPPTVTAAIEKRQDPDQFRRLLEQTLRADPRPAYHDDPDRIYTMSLADTTVRWRVADDSIIIVAIEPESELKD
jgi:tRNA-Thr(GGU) m(6)t(6)A37 methyltransferase TsaA